MPPIAVDVKRAIVDDFARLIRERQTTGPKPATAVIHFRNEKRDQVERPVMVVPISLLRYRADNGRIASDVMLLPVPAMILIRPAAVSQTNATILSFSSCVSVGRLPARRPGSALSLRSRPRWGSLRRPSCRR